MQELMEKWKTQWTEAEAQIKALGNLRADLLETETEIARALYNPGRTIQNHGFDGKVLQRIESGLNEAFGKWRLEVPLSEQAERDVAGYLKEVAK